MAVLNLICTLSLPALSADVPLINSREATSHALIEGQATLVERAKNLETEAVRQQPLYVEGLILCRSSKNISEWLDKLAIYVAMTGQSFSDVVMFPVDPKKMLLTSTHWGLNEQAHALLASRAVGQAFIDCYGTEGAIRGRKIITSLTAASMITGNTVGLMVLYKFFSGEGVKILAGRFRDLGEKRPLVCSLALASGATYMLTTSLPMLWRLGVMAFSASTREPLIQQDLLAQNINSRISDSQMQVAMQDAAAKMQFYQGLMKIHAGDPEPKSEYRSALNKYEFQKNAYQTFKMELTE